MHATDAGEKRKALKREALELSRKAKTTMKAARTLPEAAHKAHELWESSCNLKISQINQLGQ